MTDTMTSLIDLSKETIAHLKETVARLAGKELIREASALMAHDEPEARHLVASLIPQASQVTTFAEALRRVMLSQAGAM